MIVQFTFTLTVVESMVPLSAQTAEDVDECVSDEIELVSVAGTAETK